MYRCSACRKTAGRGGSGIDPGPRSDALEGEPRRVASPPVRNHYPRNPTSPQGNPIMKEREKVIAKNTFSLEV